MIAIRKQIARDFWKEVAEERQHKDLCIPKSVPPIPISAKRFCADVHALSVSGSGNEQVVNVEAHRQLGFVVTLNDDVSNAPVFPPGLGMFLISLIKGKI